MVDVLGRIQDLRDRVQRRTESREARRRRNVSVESLERLQRQRRIRDARPENRREAVRAAVRQARGLGGDVRDLATSGGSRISRAANRLEREAEALDEAGEKTSAVAKRAEAAATAGGVIEGATLDPAPSGGLMRALTEGGLTAEERAEMERSNLSEMERLVLGLGGEEDAVDRDGRPLIEELAEGEVDADDGDPLEFDDPLNVGI